LAFYLVSALQYLQQKEELSPAKESCFARRSDLESPWQIKDEVFNIRGKLLLEKPGEAPLVVMDELGRFEKNAAEFQKCVFDKLSSSVPVLGVIKDEKLPFLDTVRARPDTGVYRLTVNKRRLLKNKIMNWLKKY
ncbi:MAG: nucleoside-triphosphatase, partial [Bacillota bacterium]